MPRPFRLPAAPATRTAGRIVTALAGGYVLAAAAGALIARVMPVAAQDASAWGQLAGIALYVAALLWALAARDLRRVHLLVWGGAAAIAFVLGLLGRRP